MAKYKLNKENLINIFEVATYGSDWLGLDYSHNEKNKSLIQDGESCLADKLADIILGGSCITATDFEDFDCADNPGKDHFIFLEDMQKGLRILMEDYPEFYADLVKGNDDYYTCNNLMQCAMFGEIVYG